MVTGLIAKALFILFFTCNAVQGVEHSTILRFSWEVCSIAQLLFILCLVAFFVEGLLVMELVQKKLSI